VVETPTEISSSSFLQQLSPGYPLPAKKQLYWQILLFVQNSLLLHESRSKSSAEEHLIFWYVIHSASLSSHTIQVLGVGTGVGDRVGVEVLRAVGKGVGGKVGEMIGEGVGATVAAVIGAGVGEGVCLCVAGTGVAGTDCEDPGQYDGFGSCDREQISSFNHSFAPDTRA